MTRLSALNAQIRQPPHQGSADVRVQTVGVCAGEVSVEVVVSNPGWMAIEALALVKQGHVSITDDEIKLNGQRLNGPIMIGVESAFDGWVAGAQCKGTGACAASNDENTIGVMIHWERLPPETLWERATVANVHFKGVCVSNTPPMPPTPPGGIP